MRTKIKIQKLFTKTFYYTDNLISSITIKDEISSKILTKSYIYENDLIITKMETYN